MEHNSAKYIWFGLIALNGEVTQGIWLYKLFDEHVDTQYTSNIRVFILINGIRYFNISYLTLAFRFVNGISTLPAKKTHTHCWICVDIVVSVVMS